MTIVAFLRKYFLITSPHNPLRQIFDSFFQFVKDMMASEDNTLYCPENLLTDDESTDKDSSHTGSTDKDSVRDSVDKESVKIPIDKEPVKIVIGQKRSWKMMGESFEEVPTLPTEPKPTMETRVESAIIESLKTSQSEVKHENASYFKLFDHIDEKADTTKHNRNAGPSYQPRAGPSTMMDVDDDL
ncbi:hypothetical protein TKK_0008709 [Trichogramma kaykai]